MTSSDDRTAIEDFATAVYDLLTERARSWGLLDIGVEDAGGFIDGELRYSVGPDMGFSIDTRDGTCAYCVLVDEGPERWLEDASIVGIDITSPAEGEEQHAQVLRVLDGVLAARRPLLTKVDTPPRPGPGTEPVA